MAGRNRMVYLIFFFFSSMLLADERELVVHVSSQGLRYETGEVFLESLLNQGASPRIGHAWVALCKKNDKGIVERIEGGHSGEFGIIAPQYLERLVQSALNPDIANPIQVLYEPLEDGQFERGGGGYTPTFVASFSLTEEGYDTLRTLLEGHSEGYPFHLWSLTNYTCVRFVLTCLGRIGIVLDATTRMIVEPVISIRGTPLRMWTDSRFSSLIVDTPEKLEDELKRMVALGVAREQTIDILRK